MVILYKPQYKDLWFRKLLLSDSATMSYNHSYGGTIDFSEEKWMDWYNRWVENSFDNHFYRYIQEVNTKEFVGEVAYYPDGDKYFVSIILYEKYRGKGYGKRGLELLCKAAKEDGIKCLYDDIAIDNPSIEMFKKFGFSEEYRSGEIIRVKKNL